jgi:hypothetical protein
MKKITTILVRMSLLAAMCLSCTSCGTLLHGRLIDLKDGTVLPMTIARSYGKGAMTVHDPRDGQTYSGNYVGIRGGDVGFSSATTNFQGTGMNSMVTGTAISNGMRVSSPRAVPANAVLPGDKGGVLRARMMIQTGLVPIGTGEAVDSKGRVYGLEF